MSDQSDFVDFRDFKSRFELSMFVAKLKHGTLINIETRTNSNLDDIYRVWYYNV